LADQDEVPFSFATPAQSMDITAGATMRLLEMVRTDFPWATVFQPISSTVFGDIPIARVGHPLFPMSPYAIAKAAALHACRFYRKHYGVRVFAGIMYNHDSPRRKRGYLLDTIIEKVRRCEDGGVVTVGNPCAAVDIGFAGEYMKAAYDLVFSDADPNDFIFATGDPRGIAALVGVAAELECKSVDVASDPDYGRSASSVTGSAEELEQVIGWQLSITADEVLRMKHGPKVDPSRLK
jgi:GDPmannose 4,6-dehydratase